ncbi:MAG: hypothetical protein Q7K03_09430 [Dehalococcoidia bacterium]|nr:hypothetical protein [Dehalococcoidia bacterium]
MNNPGSSKRTPITDMVRERDGDYLAAVEELEESHGDLLAVAQAMVTYLKEAGHTPYPEDDPELGPHGPCLTCLLVVDADAAIAKATKGDAREQESPPTTE